eukprot:IDg3311t1
MLFNGAPLSVNYTDHSPRTSLLNLGYTYSLDKYSCIRSFYYYHLIFNYLIFLSGIACFITRALPPRFKAAHSWLGRVYVLSMLWSTATSLLINNTGLPLSTLVSFAAVLIGLTIAWLAIVIYRVQMTGRAIDLAQIRVAKHGIPANSSLRNIISSARADIANSKTFVQRLFSLKALHGSLFFVSWFNIAGRIFASDQSGNFECHTYPVHKPIGTNILKLVSARDPNYARLPWASGIVNWGLMVIGGAFLFAVIVGVIWSFVAGKRSKKIPDDESVVELSEDLEQVSL